MTENTDKTEKIVRFLTNWRNITRAIESLLVDNLAATAPWMAPLIPAYLAYSNMTTRLQFPIGVAICGAIVVETLGLSTVHTVFSLWDYNDARRKTDHRAPTWVAIITAIIYITIVLTVNVLLDYDSNPIELLAQALLSLLSVVAFLTLAIRANHARRLIDIQEQKREMREMRLAARIQSENASDASRILADGSDRTKDASRTQERTRRMESHSCELCGMVFPNQPSLAAHMRWTHRNGNGHKPPEPSAEEWIESMNHQA